MKKVAYEKGIDEFIIMTTFVQHGLQLLLVRFALARQDRNSTQQFNNVSCRHCYLTNAAIKHSMHQT